MLFGGHRLSVSEGTESLAGLAIQPGVGVDFWVTPNVAIRGGADYRRAFVEDDRRDFVTIRDLNQFRYHVGLAVAGGRR